MIILSCSRFKGRHWPLLGRPQLFKTTTMHWSLWRRRNQRRSFSIPILAAISWLERIWWLLVPRQLVAMRHLCSCAASRHGGTIPPSPTHPNMVQPRDLYTTTPIPASALHTSHRLVWFPLGPCLVTDEQHTNIKLGLTFRLPRQTLQKTQGTLTSA